MAPKRGRASPSTASKSSKRKSPAERGQASVRSLFQRASSSAEHADKDSGEEEVAAAEEATGGGALGPTAAKTTQPPALPLTDEEARVLRDFDLDMRYGPCVGPTRLERWQRAKRLGLEPPTAVSDLLHARPEADAANASIWQHHPAL
mmetsp:Transcript_29927/g.51181  ORF Transcript_29927/g.51181 Transcript_29927/m.51181 type:complete len:148 (-) Transcript_29927:159-602(-)